MLQVVLWVGGLFVLGLLCGQQAHAADGVAPAKGPGELVRSVTSSARQSPDSDSRPVTDEVQRVVRPVTEDVVRPVTGHVVPSAAGHVVQPIGDLVDQITDGIADGIGEGVVEQPGPPQWWPSVPQLPTLPGVPELPELPESPGLPLPAVPGQTLPVGSVAEPQQSGDASDQRQAAEKQSGGESGADGAALYGPRFAGGAVAVGDDVRDQGHARSARNTQVTGAVQAPVHQVPDGAPAGALTRHSAVDNGSPRHGDAQAVTLDERARPTLVPGAAADVTAGGLRDRHRDIPAFPG
ncbi:hypothetical protein GCM10010372_13280 [Streptomyces tauricus]|uniref:hypothetical protein n=1 Tax=Streptomyces tauricus TaxID=68274 RepID=UPI0016780E69|nr:hypothetical protein [Streptomyces tauricus]GHA14937.1 hypothetical protein GCM10010372_13280 [Streptomyces tauricus]